MMVVMTSSLAISLSASPVVAAPNSRSAAIAQLQLTDQPPNAVDLVLDAVEEHPESAETFFLAYPTLTDAQQASIRDIYLQYALDLKTAVDQYLQAINLLNNLVTGDTTNAAIAYARAAAMRYETAVYEVLFQRSLAIRSVLDVEQREAYNRDLRALLNLGTPITDSTFPTDLIGQPVEDVVEQLTLDGWALSVQTPRTLLFDRDDQELDLVIDEDFVVEEASLSEPD